MPLPPSARTATGRSIRAALGWVAIVCRAYMRPATVQDAPQCVQSGSNPAVAPANVNGAG
jgi:hypothetical protein